MTDKTPDPGSESDSKSWITISISGARAGVCVAGLTYYAAEMSSRAIAESSRRTIETVGSLIGLGADYAVGPSTGIAVRIASKALAASTKHTINSNTYISSGIIAAAAGAVTALSITIGAHAINYTIEYGGKLTKELAVKLSETYIQYKAARSDFSHNGDVNLLEDDDWLIIEDSTNSDATELQTLAPNSTPGEESVSLSPNHA